MLLFNRKLSFESTAAVSNGLIEDGLEQKLIVFRRLGFANTTALQDVVNFNPTTTVTASNFTLNRPLQIASSSTADSATGTNARTVTIFGVLASGLLGSETVTLNGTTPVNVLTNFRNVNSMEVTTAASLNGLPAGVITLRETAAPTNTFLQIALSTASESSLFTVPANTKGVISSLTTSVYHSTSSTMTRVAVLVSSQTGIFKPVLDVTIDGNKLQQLTFNTAIPPLSTVKITATPSATQANLRVSGSLEMTLVSV